MTMIGHVLWEMLMFINGFISSLVSPSTTFWGFEENDSYCPSKCFQVIESNPCLNTPSSMRLSWCHLMSEVVFIDINNHWSLSNRGNNIVYSLNLFLLLGFHLLSSHIGHWLHCHSLSSTICSHVCMHLSSHN